MGSAIEAPPPAGTWGVSARYLGTNFTVDNLTAVSPGVASLSWGPDWVKGNFGVTPATYQNVIGGGPHIVYETFAATPYSIDFKSHTIEFDAAVTNYSGDGVAQLCVVSYYHNTVNNKTVAVLWAVYDNRYATYTPFAANDTMTDFYSMPIQVMSSEPGMGMQRDLFGPKHYQIDVSLDKLESVFPTEAFEVSSWKFIGVVMLSEVFVTPTQSVSTGFEVKNIKVLYS